MAAFGQLPVEIRITILQYSCDLSSLWRSVQASRDIAIVFDEYGPEIIEAVVANTVPVKIQSLMRAVLRTHADLCPHLKQAQGITSIDEQVPLKRGELRDSRVPSRFLSLAHQIHSLAHACINHYIETSLTVRPFTAVKFPPGVINVRQRFDEAERCEISPQRTGPPSWVEEQRVIKALWRIQFFFELNLARDRKRLEWPQEDQDALVDIAEFFAIRDFELQQVFTVYEFMYQTREQRKAMDSYRLPAMGADMETINTCAEPRVFAARHDHYQQGPGYVDAPPLSYIFQNLMAHGRWRGPIPGLPFWIYRKYGFAIWDDQRMTDLGFAEAHGGAILKSSAYFFRWYSILTEEEKTAH
jgi:hypothetical protein